MKTYCVTVCWFETEYEYCIVVADNMQEAEVIGRKALNAGTQPSDVELLDLSTKGVVCFM